MPALRPHVPTSCRRVSSFPAQPPALVGWVRFWAPRFRVRSSHRARGCRHVRRGCAYPFVLFMLAGPLIRMGWGVLLRRGLGAYSTPSPGRRLASIGIS